MAVINYNNRLELTYTESFFFKYYLYLLYFADIFHDQDVRQSQSRTGAETGGFRQAVRHVGRRAERGRQVRGQVPAGQGSRRRRRRQTR